MILLNYIIGATRVHILTTITAVPTFSFKNSNTLLSFYVFMSRLFLLFPPLSITPPIKTLLT